MKHPALLHRYSCMRKPRLIVQGARYHVMARANRSERIMDRREMKELFIVVLKRARKRYRFTVDSICLMENHFHMVILPHAGENLSRIMQWIMSVFAMAWNRKKGLKGHVWGGRFLSSVIGGFRGLCEVMRYIDANPVKAGLVEYLWAWEYGAISLRRVLWGEAVMGAPSQWLRQTFPAHAPLALPRLIG